MGCFEVGAVQWRRDYDNYPLRSSRAGHYMDRVAPDACAETSAQRRHCGTAFHCRNARVRHLYRPGHTDRCVPITSSLVVPGQLPRRGCLGDVSSRDKTAPILSVVVSEGGRE
jgi:hypothetical protein